ncbi:MAG: WD40/YVTN/BNR-like repeat-containing protein [Haloferacaceae archaeon]
MAIYLALEEALLVVGDDGATDRRLTAHRPECVLAHPGGEWVLCGTFDAGLHRSTDGGETFERVGEGTIEQSVTSLARNPHDASEVWVGTEPSRVYRSTDGGETFTERGGLLDLSSASSWSFPPRPDTHHVRWIEVDPADPARLFVSIEAGALLRTDDRGATWADRVPTSRRDNHELATHPDAPGRAWAAAGDGYAETRDGGDSWDHPQEGLDHRYCWSVAVDPADPETVLLSAATGAYAAHGHRGVESAESYLYRKRGGDSWERLDDRGVPTGDGVLRSVIRAGDAGGAFYAANNRGLYRTTDAGATWREVAVEWDDADERQAVRGLAIVE